MRVLVVDDEEFVRLKLREVLEHLGQEVVGEASCAEEALRLYRQLRPDLITMDVTMPGGDGIAATRALLSEDPRARVVMVTALGDRQTMLEALRAGACDYLVKPVRARLLQEALQRLQQEVD